MSEWINVNGVVTAPQSAVVPALDRGFLYGDAVYETVRTYGGRPFRLRQHLDRLCRSAESLEIPHARAPVDVHDEVMKTLLRADNEESAVRVVLSRGPAPIGYDPTLAGPPTLVIYVRPCPIIPDSWRREGVDVTIVHVQRNPEVALNPAIKSNNLLNNLMAWMQALKMAAYEPILPNAAGHLTEGASSNIFVVREGRLRTPDLGAGILQGITRDLVLGLARRDGMNVAEETILPQELREADEAFLTSTLKGILPVRRCDGWPIRDGRPGPVTSRLIQLFEATVQEETNAGSPPGSIRR
jgi:branched-chain amino acid aminotransferase